MDREWWFCGVRLAGDKRFFTVVAGEEKAMMRGRENGDVFAREMRCGRFLEERKRGDLERRGEEENQLGLRFFCVIVIGLGFRNRPYLGLIRL